MKPTKWFSSKKSKLTDTVDTLDEIDDVDSTYSQAQYYQSLIQGSYGGSGGYYTTSSGSITIPTNTTSTTGMWTLSNTYKNVTLIGATEISDSDITIIRRNKKPIKVAETLEFLLEQFNIIIPDKKLLESNPALALAYENYLEVLKTSIVPKLKEAYNNYKVLETLSKSDGE